MIVRELLALLGFKFDASGAKKFEATYTDLRFMAIDLANTVRAVGTQLFKLADDTANAGKHAEEAALLLGISAQAVQELDYAAVNSSVSVEEMGTAMRELSRNVAEAGRGEAGAAKAFARIGISAKDAAGKAKPVDQLFGELAEKFENLPADVSKADVAMGLFGRQGAKLVPLLSGGAEGLAALRREAVATGYVLGEDALASAKAFDDSVDALTGRLTGLRNIAGGVLMPIIREMVDQISDWIDANRELVREGLAEAGDVLKTFAAETIRLFRYVNQVVQAFGGWKNVLKLVAAGIVAMQLGKLGATIGSLTGNLGTLKGALGSVMKMMTGGGGLGGLLTGGAFAALLAGIYLLYDDVTVFLRGGDSLIGRIKTGIQKFITDTAMDPSAFWLTEALAIALETAGKVFSEISGLIELAMSLKKVLMPTGDYAIGEREEAEKVIRNKLPAGVADFLIDQNNPKKRAQALSAWRVADMQSPLAMEGRLRAPLNPGAVAQTTIGNININGAGDPKAVANELLSRLNEVQSRATEDLTRRTDLGVPPLLCE